MRIRTHGNPLNFTTRLTPIALDDVFANPSAPIDLEIGFGRGVFLRHWAQEHPNRNIIGVEVRKSAVEILKDRVATQQLSNVHLIHHNGQVVLEDCFAENSLDSIFIFHPDPWIKKRHHKRRVVNPEFLGICHNRLKKNGRLYLSTDVDFLWEAMTEELLADARFEPVSDDEFWERYYTSHWHEFSERDQRSVRFGIWKTLPTLPK